MNDILNMQVGEELDALVAEKVFNRLITWNRAFQYLTEEERESNIKAFVTIPEYSTNIVAAWEVVEKIKTKFIEIWYDGKKWVCEIGVHDHITATAETAPHAICLAALLALEGNRGD